MYSEDKTIQTVLAMFKAYGIRNIVLSPGTRNSGFSASVQNDSWFNAFSVVDERGAGYFATGLAFETNEPVVICCTGATASRNYLSALTEAYYRRLPVIALTFGYEHGDYTLTPQFVDRSLSQNDVKLCTVTLPRADDAKSKSICELMLNDALIKCLHGRRGPVHINVLHFSYAFGCQALPQVQKVDYLSAYDVMSSKKMVELMFTLTGRKLGVFIGSHNKMSAELTDGISAFAKKFNAPVFVDHTSNYHGANKVLLGQICDIMLTENRPDVLIDFGGICGQYSLARLFKDTEVWRLSEGGGVQQRAGRVTLLIDCREEFFFRKAAVCMETGCTLDYFAEIRKELEGLTINNVPFSGVFVAQHYSKKVPAGSSFHSSILNSLRASNFFSFDESIDYVSNVGGFGIDGALSTLLGQSVTNRDRLFFAQVGDLAFFYDMNAAANRHLGSNIRILLVNNGVGAEFVIDQNHRKNNGKYHVEPFIAATGHNGSARDWVKSCGFEYMSASTKEEFLEKLEEFCHPDVKHFSRPVVFEVFTKGEDEAESIVGMACPKPKTQAAILKKDRCALAMSLLACFIFNKKKRREFRQKHCR